MYDAWFMGPGLIWWRILGCTNGYNRTECHLLLDPGEQNRMFKSTHLCLDVFYVSHYWTPVLTFLSWRTHWSWPWRANPILLIPVLSCTVCRAGASWPLGTLWNVTREPHIGSHTEQTHSNSALLSSCHDLWNLWPWTGPNRKMGGEMEDRDLWELKCQGAMFLVRQLVPKETWSLALASSAWDSLRGHGTVQSWSLHCRNGLGLPGSSRCLILILLETIGCSGGSTPLRSHTLTMPQRKGRFYICIQDKGI